MKRWMQTLTGLVMSAFLTLGLSSRSRAANTEDALPESAPMEAVAPCPEELLPPEAVETDEFPGETQDDADESEAAETDELPTAATDDDDIPTATLTDELPTATTDDDVVPTATQTDELPTVTTDDDVVPTVTQTDELPTMTTDDDVVPTATQTAELPAATLTVSRRAVPLSAAASGTEEAETVETDILVDGETPAGETEEAAAVSLRSTPPSTDDSGNEVAVNDPAGAPVVIVGGTAVDGTEDVTGDNWRYLADSQRLILINYDGSTGDVTTGESGASILTAGVNRIHTLTCSGNVTLLGTGILLVDEVQMLEDSSLSLQTNTSIYPDGIGSVALFINTGENEYTLANDYVPGILDESYTIEGLRLIVPSESTLLLNSVGAYANPETGETEYYFGESSDIASSDYDLYTESASMLTIGNGASLVVDEGGIVRMESLESRVMDIIYRPKLQTTGSGTLTVDGIVEGDGLVEARNAGGGLFGDGTISGNLVSVSADLLPDSNLTLTGHDVHVYGSSVDALHVKDTMVRFFEAVDIGSVISEGNTVLNLPGGSYIEDAQVVSGELNLRQIPVPCTYAEMFSGIRTISGDILLTGHISGEGKLVFDSGSFLITDSATADIGEASSLGATVLDYSEQGILSGVSVTPLSCRPEDLPQPEEEDAIPLYPWILSIYDYGDENRSTRSASVYQIIDPAKSTVTPPTIPASGPIDLAELKEYADALIAAEKEQNLSPLISDSYYTIDIVRTTADGTLSMTSYGFDSLAGEISSDGVHLIRVTFYLYATNPNAGSTATNTATSFTGTGVLGGPNAGSVRGGQNRVLFRGNTSPHDPDPDPDPDPNPDPNPAPDPDPDPAPTSTRGAALLVVVDPTEDGRYTLEVLDGRTGMPVADQLVEARTPFVCPEGWDTEYLFVVFRQADGTLVAVRARFDAVTGELLFETDLSGVFAVVSFPYAGELFSDAFYAALETLDAIRNLPVRR